MKAATLLVLLPSFASAAILHVDSSARPGGDGSSPADAFQFLRDALAVAHPRDEIRIAQGIYHPDEGRGATGDDPAESFVLIDQITLRGGYKPGATDGEPDPPAFPTILSGDIDKNDTVSSGVVLSSGNQNGANSRNVVRVSGASSGVLLSGLVITGGDSPSTADSHGGGLIAVGSKLVLEECWFVGNQADGRGGALHLDHCDATVTNVRFSGNFAVARGGAVGTLNGSSAGFVNCLFWGNEAQRGGALNLNNSSALLLNCTVSGNDGTINGGGIQSTNSASVTVTDSIIWRNRAAGSENTVGASYNLLSSGTVSLSASSIVGNVSGSDPDFVTEFNPANAPGTGGNLRLTRGSPAINAGTSSANTAPLDLDGNPRVAGAAIDLGAFERRPFDIHVDDTAGGANNGTSWANAYTTLQPALAAALAGDRILIAEGVYKPATAGASFEIPANVEIYGGYPNGGGARDPSTRLSILSGDVDDNDINTDGNFIAEQASHLIGTNASTVVTTASGVDLTPLNILDGLVITAGRAVPALPTANGDPTSEGGGVHFEGDRPVFRNCLFSGNRAYESGGAIHIVNGPAASLGEDGPIFEDCEFIGNRSDLYGGAMTSLGGRTVIDRCTFEGNRAPNGAALAHRASGGQLTLRSTLVAGNENGDANGVVLLEASTASTFLNCLLRGNEGNAVDLFGVLTLRGCTIAGNEARPVLKSGPSTALGVWNSIFWDNGQDYLAQGGGSLAQFHHNLIEGWAGTEAGFANKGNLDGSDPGNDPDFVSPIGGGAAPTTLGNHRLQYDSPVMSVGDNAEADAATDLDGNPRISGHTVDLGAYEYVLPDLDNDGISDAFELAHTSPASATSLHPSANLDDDDWTALEEFAFGTDPNVAEGSDAAYHAEWVPGPQKLSVYWTPNPDAVHYVRIIPEHSLDLGLTDPWKEFAIKAGNGAGEFRVDTQTISPLQEKQFLRLRVEK